MKEIIKFDINLHFLFSHTMRACTLFIFIILTFSGCGSGYPSWSANKYDVEVGLASKIGEKIVIDTSEKEKLRLKSGSIARSERLKEEAERSAELLRRAKIAAWENSIEKRQTQDLEIAFKTAKINKSQFEVMKNQLKITFEHRFERERQEEEDRRIRQAEYSRHLRQIETDRRNAREEEKWRRFGEQLGRALAQ